MNTSSTASVSVKLGPSGRRLLGLLVGQRLRMVAVVLLTLGTVATYVIGPLLTGRAVDLVFAGAIGQRLPADQTKEAVVDGLRAHGQATFAEVVSRMDLVPGVGIDFAALGELLLLALALFLVGSAFQYAQTWVLNDAVQDVVEDLRNRVSAKLHRMPLGSFQASGRGDLLSRVTNDIDNIAQTLSQTLSQLLFSLLTVVGVLAMMLHVSPMLTLVAVIAIPLASGLSRVVMKRSQPRMVERWAHTGALNAQIEEAYSGHDVLTAFGRRGEAQERFDAENNALRRAGWMADFISGLMTPIMMCVSNLTYVAVCVVGGLRVASGSLTVGDVTAFVQYSRQFTQPLSQIASMTNLMQSGVASAERVFELLDAPEETPDAPGRLDAVRGHVQFEDVGFSYSPEQPLIEHLDLDVQPGRTVAIVGPTGAGKSTLINLLLRFYDADSGRILLDGRPITEIPRDQLRSRIGMVLQDTWLFRGSIRDNIAYGNLHATEEQIREAARETFVERFVHTLPDSYDTVVQDDGANLSVGQRQLITIARAALAAPRLLILDEATSSVDTRTEALLQQAMTALRTGRTSFVIAHRLSTIRDADTILVMEGGAIVEQGSHDELLAHDGAYRRLYDAQFAGT
ncbi:ABC transporter ATP-binding protein [Yimella sp. cx-573]|nr:ABC transporter ATP-binding protein [Yimella sp. cx-573]